MDGQTIAFGFDKEGVWSRVSGRLSVFLDSNGWIEMADAVDDATCRVRDRLQAAVASGRVFCPLSWGVLEELFKQSGDSLRRTGRLMEELSLNAILVMHTELYQWEFSRSVRRASGARVDESLVGLFAAPAAFVGSGPCIRFEGVSISPQTRADAQAYMKRARKGIFIFSGGGKMPFRRAGVSNCEAARLVFLTYAPRKAKGFGLFLGRYVPARSSAAARLPPEGPPMFDRLTRRGLLGRLLAGLLALPRPAASPAAACPHPAH
jgi:hypothetical protein